MAEQLTSVRFDRDTLDKLRAVADTNESNIAEEVRVAVRRYLEALASDPEFKDRAERADAQRQERIKRLLSQT